MSEKEEKVTAEEQETQTTGEEVSSEEERNEEQNKEDVDKEAQEELDPVAENERKITELNDKYLRLYSEFENFRRRTAKERLDLIGSAGGEIIAALLPVLDDLDRAVDSAKNSNDIESIRKGQELIQQKIKTLLIQKGLKEMDAMKKEFDVELHEAITKIPAPEKKLKGKVVDVIEKGYFLNDKVIRYAKVVIGE